MTTKSDAIPQALLQTIERILKSYPAGDITYSIGKPMPFAAAKGLEHPVIVIPDIHGHSAPMAVLLREVMEAYPSASLRFLGDLVHRGPDSGGALALAITACMALEDERGSRSAILHPGNHEEMLLNILLALAGEIDLDKNPHVKKLLQYIRENKTWERNFIDDEDPAASIQNDILSRMPEDYADIIRSLGGVVPWVMNCPVASRTGDLVFVHAGIPPIPTAEHDPVGWAEQFPILRSDNINPHPRWVNEGVVGRTKPFPGGYSVIFGHMIDPEYSMALEFDEPIKIDAFAPTLGLDAGSYDYGVILAGIFENGTVRLAHVSFDPHTKMERGEDVPQEPEHSNEL